MNKLKLKKKYQNYRNIFPPVINFEVLQLFKYKLGRLNLGLSSGRTSWGEFLNYTQFTFCLDSPHTFIIIVIII